MLGKKACSVAVSSLMVLEMTGFGSLAYAVESKDGDSDVAQETTQNLDAENQGQSKSEGDEAFTQAADVDASGVVPGADAPTSPTNASTHLDISAADLLSEEIGRAHV